MNLLNKLLKQALIEKHFFGRDLLSIFFSLNTWYFPPLISEKKGSGDLKGYIFSTLNPPPQRLWRCSQLWRKKKAFNFNFFSLFGAFPYIVANIVLYVFFLNNNHLKLEIVRRDV